MDPDAAWKELRTCLIDYQKSRARELAFSLLGWLQKDGLMPAKCGMSKEELCAYLKGILNGIDCQGQ